jgi:hypothetical protein
VSGAAGAAVGTAVVAAAVAGAGAPAGCFAAWRSECLLCQPCAGAVVDVVVVLLSPQAICELLWAQTS